MTDNLNSRSNTAEVTHNAIEPLPQLLPQHLAMLKASAISIDVVEARGYRSMSSRHNQPDLEALGFSKAQALVPGLLIPLWSIDGKVGGYQYRPDNPRKDKNGKPIKYETPKGQRNILDIPPTVREAVRQGQQVVFVTEGARKADAIASLGAAVISLTGVYGWRGKNKDGGYTALSDWEDIAIKGNVFILAFDSDILTKPEVHQALSRQKQFLDGRGAKRVRVLVLPQILSGKMGVDDYIFETGATLKDLARLVVDELPLLNNPQSEAEPVHVTTLADVPPLDELLNTVAAFITRYLVLTTHQRYAVTLWAAHTHALDAFDVTPYLDINSPEKRSGKTLLLELLDLLVARPWLTGRTTTAALSRKVDKVRPTLLLDESDAAFKGDKEYAETLRGVLNTGYKRNGVVTVCIGQGANIDFKDFSTFCPKAIAGIGKLPDTVKDRSIPISLKRKAPHEKVERLRRRVAAERAKLVYEGLAGWAASDPIIQELREARPDIPTLLNDRAGDGWEPLLAIANLAGGDWPRRAHEAALALSASGSSEADSLGVRLLGDIHTAFLEAGNDRLPTEGLLKTLNEMEESPWGGFHDGAGMTGRDLAGMIKKYDIAPKQIKFEVGGRKGYEIESFVDAFSRYAVRLSETNETTVYDGTDRPKSSETYPSMVSDDITSLASLQTKVSLVSDKEEVQASWKAEF